VNDMIGKCVITENVGHEARPIEAQAEDRALSQPEQRLK